jgi:hypothetical protein
VLDVEVVTVVLNPTVSLPLISGAPVVVLTVVFVVVEDVVYGHSMHDAQNH